MPLSDILSQVVQKLVEERLKILELTIFDKHFKELKDRVDKIDCATKHQTAINTLQVGTWPCSCVEYGFLQGGHIQYFLMLNLHS